jgi:predicted MFS family arabinose efflux permease
MQVRRSAIPTSNESMSIDPTPTSAGDATPPHASAAASASPQTSAGDAPSPPKNLVDAWQPLRSALFRSVWIATVVSNIGSWMEDVGSGWLMTSLSSSPALVALIEAADSFPVMLLALPAGALADIIDRRRLLIVVHCYLLVCAGMLGVLTALGLTTISILLGLTFAMGVGNALVMPAWSAIVPELVPRAQLPSAIALNSIAINVSRAVGPAIAGLIIAAMGVWPVYILNALSYIGILVVLIRWRRDRRRSALPAERFVSAIRVGLRFVTHTRSLQIVLLRGGAFFAFASASWALFPLIVRRELGRGPEVYGLLLTCIGAGAVIGALLLPRIRARFSRDVLVAAASILYAVAMFVLAGIREIFVLALAMVMTGAAWISILSALQVSAQLSLPSWVRARGLAAFLMVFMGGMAIGAVAWGQVATWIGIPDALAIAGLGVAASALLALKFKLGDREAPDLRPSMHWAPPVIADEEPEPDSGPVMVSIEYLVDPAKRKEFVAAMQPLGEVRRRNGAYFWQLFHDTANPARYFECFMDESWLEHLRQHERVSAADRAIQNHAKSFLMPGTTTHSSHWLADRPDPE